MNRWPFDIEFELIGENVKFTITVHHADEFNSKGQVQNPEGKEIREFTMTRQEAYQFGSKICAVSSKTAKTSKVGVYS